MKNCLIPRTIIPQTLAQCLPQLYWVSRFRDLDKENQQNFNGVKTQLYGIILNYGISNFVKVVFIC